MKIPAISAMRLTAFKNSSPQPALYMQENSACLNTEQTECKQKDNKKQIAGFIAAAVAITAGVIYAVKRNKFPAEVKGAKKRADEFAQIVNKKIKNAVELYNNGGKDANGNIVARIRENLSDSSIKIMEEIPEDASISLRKSRFKDGILDTIEEILDNKMQNIVVMKEGKLYTYQEGIQKQGSEDLMIAKEAYFKNNKPEIYTEGVEYTAGNHGGEWKQTMQLRLSEKGKPLEYQEGVEYTKEKGHRVLKRFLNGKFKTNTNT